MGLTPKQQQVLDFIQGFVQEQGYAPSQWEIANHFGYRSLGTVQDYLVRLEEQGYLEKVWNGKRSISLRQQENTLPLLGRVAAGRPIEAISNYETIEVPPSMIGAGKGELFALLVKGQSMVEDGILDGDHIIVRKQASAENGATVVALVDGEATVKRFYRKARYVELRPANSQYQPIKVKASQDLKIEGVLVGVIRHIS